MMRPVFAIIAALVLGALWLGPLPELARTSFTAHMTLHMGVVALASAFVALSVAGGRLDPASRWPTVFAPVAASIVELVVVWTWHAPALHHIARSSTLGLVLEQGTFVLAGTWLWISALGGGRSTILGTGAGAALMAHVLVRAVRAVRRRRAAGVAGLLLTSMHMTLLGALLALTPRPLYSHPGATAWMTPLEDQHLGGAIMLLVGGIAYLAGGLWLTAGILRHPHTPKSPSHSAGSETRAPSRPPAPGAPASSPSHRDRRKGRI